MRWFKDGDSYTNFFSLLCERKEKKLYIIEIHTTQGDMVNSNKNIEEEVVFFFANNFREKGSFEDFSMLNYIPKFINEEQNKVMNVLPTIKEVKSVVCKINEDSTSVPDGFASLFFQSCWDIVGCNITDLV